MKNATELGFTVTNGCGPFVSFNELSEAMKPLNLAVGNEVTLKWEQYRVSTKITQLPSPEFDEFTGSINFIEPFTSDKAIPFAEGDDLQFTFKNIITASV